MPAEALHASAPLGDVSLDALWFAAIAVAGIAYGLRARRLARRGYPVPVHRALLFALALLVLAAAEAPPLHDLDEEHFSIHMAQHLLIGDIGPVLAVIGLSGAMVRPLLTLPGARRLRALSDPRVVAPAWAATMVLWHLPPLYDAALAHDAVHGLQHVMFLGTGLLLWASALGPLPAADGVGYPARLMALAVAWVIGGVLSNVLLWSDRVLYPAYRDAPGALGDQRLGGGIMLVEMSATVIAAGIVVGLAWMRDAERRQRVAETRAHRAALR
jgi:cytochrome c oxidase assembly factor CtaG